MLNTLLGSPLGVISPCSLFDGHKAVLYSLQPENVCTACDTHAAKLEFQYLTSLLGIDGKADYGPSAPGVGPYITAGDAFSYQPRRTARVTLPRTGA